MSKDNNGGVLKWILGALGGYSLIGTLTSEPTVSLYPLTSEMSGELSGTTSENVVAGTTLGTIGVAGSFYLFESSSGFELLGIVNGRHIYRNNSDGNIFTELNDQDSILDERAQKVYDKYHRNHKKVEVGGILFENEEVRKEFFNIINNAKNKKELYYHLRALEEMLTELIEEEKEEKTKKLERK